MYNRDSGVDVVETLEMEVEDTLPMEVPEWKPEMHESCSRYWNEIELGMRRFEEELEAELDKQDALQQEQETETFKAFGGEDKHAEKDSDEEKHQNVPEEEGKQEDQPSEDEHMNGDKPMNGDGYCSCEPTESEMSDDEDEKTGNPASSSTGLENGVEPNVSCMHFLNDIHMFTFMCGFFCKKMDY